MARKPSEDPPPPAEMSVVQKLGVVFVITAILGFSMCIFMMVTPQSLDDLDGLDPNDRGRNLTDVLRESHNRQIPITLREAEINQWLATSLEVNQARLLDEEVKFKRVAVRMMDGTLEVILEREWFDRPMTLSMFFSVEQQEEGDRIQTTLHLHGGRYAAWLPVPPRGGRFGQLIVPQGFLRLTMPAYQSLADAMTDELELGFKKMARIKLEDKKIHLDPRIPTREAD